MLNSAKSLKADEVRFYKLDKTTTKALAIEVGVNEVNIYRIFDDKENLFKKTFTFLDDELISIILKHFPVMDRVSMPIEDCCRALFFFIWKFIVENSDKCMCFIRYHYSPYFQKYSCEEHKAAYRIVVEKFALAFRKGADVAHILDFMLISAVKVFNR